MCISLCGSVREWARTCAGVRVGVCESARECTHTCTGMSTKIDGRMKKTDSYSSGNSVYLLIMSGCTHTTGTLNSLKEFLRDEAARNVALLIDAD